MIEFVIQVFGDEIRCVRKEADLVIIEINRDGLRHILLEDIKKEFLVKVPLFFENFLEKLF